MNDYAIEAVLFDLDDTLYPQSDFLAGAWRAVAETVAETSALPAKTVLDALKVVAAKGSDRGRIIDRALESLGLRDVDVGPLVAAFRNHAPPRLRPYPGVRRALRSLRARVPIGLITDGDVGIQRAKLRALRLAGAFDVLVFSDELGRQHRKPDPLPFMTALRALRLAGGQTVYIGDRSDKDVVGASAAGLRTIRVFTGEYAASQGHVAPWREAPDVVAAIAICEPYITAAAPSRPEGQATRIQHD